MESFSNPMAPPELMDPDDSGDEHHPLTNADFRKMMMTPRAPGLGGVSSQPSSKAAPARHLSQEAVDEEDDPATRRKKKKLYYAKLKRLEEERKKELDEKYRDRARERRDGHHTEYDQTEMVSTTADYRAVAPDAKSIENYAERRKQVIQESKYLGGDMEHTHLVKGLDYALLEKVRAEISSKEREDEQEMEKVVTQTKEKKEEEPEVQMLFKTKMGRNIFRTLFKSKEMNRNELFLPGRMAYVVDLEDEFADSDIPCTTIRSKADCPSLEQTTTLTTNDIVINKLTQILSYLRQGRRDKKLKKLKEKGKLKEAEKQQSRLPGADDSIYGDLTDYASSLQKSKDKRDRKDRDREDVRDNRRDREREHRDYRDRDREKGRRERERSREREREKDRGVRSENKRKSYFEKPVEEDEDRSHTTNVKELVKTVTDRYRGYAEVEEEKERKAAKKEQERLKKIQASIAIDSYAECYPGMEAAADAIEDSDEEVDYTKMDQGNKKGPVGRWDFDTQEEYSDYMANKEALPKAAFQYGVKMSDGRKTRRAGPKDEKAELDRQWQQIQNIMNKRKNADDREDSKKMKY